VPITLAATGLAPVTSEVVLPQASPPQSPGTVSHAIAADILPSGSRYLSGLNASNSGSVPIASPRLEAEPGTPSTDKLKVPDIMGSETKTNAEKKQFEESQRKRLADVIEFYYKTKKNLEPLMVDDLNIASLPRRQDIHLVGRNAAQCAGYGDCIASLSVSCAPCDVSTLNSFRLASFG
jgi:hypothetical protein